MQWMFWYRSPLKRQSISQWYTMWLTNKMCAQICPYPLHKPSPHSKFHGTNIESIWGRQNLGGPQVSPMKFAIWEHNVIILRSTIHIVVCLNKSDWWHWTIFLKTNFIWYSLPYGHSSCMSMDKHKIFVTPVRKLLFWLRCNSNCTLDKETHLFVTWDANTYMCESLKNINHSFKNTCRYIY